jgi:hypothetical protein
MKKRKVLLGMTALASVITLASCKKIYINPNSTTSGTSGEVESSTGENSNLSFSESNSISQEGSSSQNVSRE